MGLRIRPKSKLRALQCRVYSWETLKAVFRGEPIDIAWDSISEILPIAHEKNPHYHLHFQCAEGYQSSVHFFSDEVESFSAFEAYLTNNPEKIRSNKFNYFRGQVVDTVGPYFRYGAVNTKYIIAALAFTFMYFQVKYFGSLLIQKYQFLINASCNQQCAQELWSISTLWFYVLLMTLSPLIPFLFYKKIYSNVLRSKNVQVINGTMTETFLLAAIGLTLLITASPKIWSSTSRYSNILASYSDGTLETKLSQKVEMASKRKFQGDVDEVEEVEIIEDFREE